MKALKFSVIFFGLCVMVLNTAVAQKKVSELTVVYDYAVTAADAGR